MRKVDEKMMTRQSMCLQVEMFRTTFFAMNEEDGLLSVRGQDLPILRACFFFLMFFMVCVCGKECHLALAH